jgi:hypothetical protein
VSAPTRFPLCWPDTMPRKTGSREAGSFKTGLAGALANVESSLKLFGRDSGKPVSEVVISSNVTLGHTKPADPGVAVWFTWEEQSICIPVDRYSSVEANLQAIHHVLEARRTELRHGTLALVRATMKGFQALPAPESWRKILGLEPDARVTSDIVNEAYRNAARLAGPNSNRLTEINMARDRARQELSL